MAKSEWGPASNNRGTHALREVTRFAVQQLKEIEEASSLYLSNHPARTRDEIGRIGGNEKGIARVHDALEILNQLAAVGRTTADIQGTIIVREDPKEKVPYGNGNHTYYEVDWIHEPNKAASKPTVKPRAVEPKQRTERPELTAEQRNELFRTDPVAFEKAMRREHRARRNSPEAKAARAEKRELERQAEEREAIEKVIIDKGREAGEGVLNSGQVKIVLNADGTAPILKSRWWYKVNLDETDYEEVKRSSIRDSDSDFLRYLETFARELEGKNPEPYKPKDIDPAALQDIYDRAIKERILLAVGSLLNDKIQFYFLRNTNFRTSGHSSKIDLERGVIEGDPEWKYIKERPLHPQFAAHLRTKAAEFRGFTS